MSDEEHQFLKNFELELKNNVALKEDPSKLGALIVSTIQALDQSSQALESSRSSMNHLKNRSFVQRIFSNNVRDIATSSSQLADAVGLQNRGLQTFLSLIKSVVFLNIGNMQFLLRLSDELKVSAGKVKLDDPTIFDIATSFLDEAIKGAEYQDAQLDYLKKSFKNETDQLKILIDQQQSDIKKLKERIKNITVAKNKEGFRWPFYFMAALNLVIIFLLLSASIKNLFS